MSNRKLLGVIAIVSMLTFTLASCQEGASSPTDTKAETSATAEDSVKNETAAPGTESSAGSVQEEASTGDDGQTESESDIKSDTGASEGEVAGPQPEETQGRADQ